MKTYSCPKCGRDVSAKDVNVAKDLMLCPSCGEVSSFSALMERSRVREEEDDGRRLLSAPPPEHLTVETDSTDLSGRVVLTYRHVSPNALFLVPFTLVWAGGSMAGIYGSQIVKRAFDWKLSLFGLPFLIGSVALVSYCLFLLFGRRTLTLERGRGRYFYGVGPFGFSRRFVYDRQTEVRTGEARYAAGGGRHRAGGRLDELHLTRPCSSDTVRVCAGMSADALAYIAAVLRREAARV